MRPATAVEYLTLPRACLSTSVPSGPPGVRFSCCAPQLVSGQRINNGSVTGCHAVQHWRFPLRRLVCELGIPGAVPRRDTDSQTIRLFQREESSWEVNQSHRHGWDWRRGCRNNPRAWLQPYPQRAPKLGVLVASRLSRRNEKDGFVNVLFCGEEEGGRGVWL